MRIRDGKYDGNGVLTVDLGTLHSFFVESFSIEEGIQSVQSAVTLLSLLNAGSIVHVFFLSIALLYPSVSRVLTGWKFPMIQMPILKSRSGRILPNFLVDKPGPLGMFIACNLLFHMRASRIRLDRSQKHWRLDSSLSVLWLCLWSLLALSAVTTISLSPHLRVIAVKMGMPFAVASIGILIEQPVRIFPTNSVTFPHRSLYWLWSILNNSCHVQRRNFESQTSMYLDADVQRTSFKECSWSVNQL